MQSSSMSGFHVFDIVLLLLLVAVVALVVWAVVAFSRRASR